MQNPNVSVDCVVFGFDGQKLNVLLIEQEDFGQACRLALPGDHLEDEEDLDQSAARVLRELTGLSGLYLQQCGTFGNPNRVKDPKDLPWLTHVRKDPTARVITVAYYALVKMTDFNLLASSFAARAFWHDANEIPRLAFDHNSIFDQALATLRRELSELRVGFELLPNKFTLSQMQAVHEAILNSNFDKRNFRKKALNDQWVVPLDEKQTGVVHKPARLYTRNLERAQN
jgi:8-oxo-dGTP diphosphatase